MCYTNGNHLLEARCYSRLSIDRLKGYGEEAKYNAFFTQFLINSYFFNFYESFIQSYLYTEI